MEHERIAKLKQQFPEGTFLENEPMNKHTSFKVGGPARYFVKAESLDDLKKALDLAREKGIPFFILGNGTNLLVSDNGFDGVIVTLARDFSHAR